jgi:hypothetical protein
VFPGETYAKTGYGPDDGREEGPVDGRRLNFFKKSAASALRIRFVLRFIVFGLPCRVLACPRLV